MCAPPCERAARAHVAITPLRVAHFASHLLRLQAPPYKYGLLDWPKLLRPHDAFLDVPIPELLPWLLAAFPRMRSSCTRRASRWTGHGAVQRTILTRQSR